MTESQAVVRRRVMFVCTANSARSQMAEGLLRMLGGGRFEAHSAGRRPAGVNPTAVEAMREIGGDLSGHRSKSLDEYVGQPFDVVITVCDNAAESCPVFPGGGQRLHWSFADPAAVTGSDAERLAAFREVRDGLRARIEGLVQQIDREEARAR